MIKKGRAIKAACTDLLNGFAKVREGEFGIVQLEGDNDYLVIRPDDWGILDAGEVPSKYRTVMRLRLDEINAFLVAAFGLTATRLKYADNSEDLAAGEQLGCVDTGTHNRGVSSGSESAGAVGRVPGPDDNHNADDSEGNNGPKAEAAG